MKAPKLVGLILVVVGLLAVIMHPRFVAAQEKDKGELEDFADDFGEEESEGNSSTEEAAEFFLWVFLESIGDIAHLWGGTPETEFGPFPGYPYAGTDGFMTHSNDYRSYFFNTEFNYHYLNSNLRSYLFKWETQFVGTSKLSFDLALYEELRSNAPGLGSRKDYITFYGIRYGHALYRTPQMILNLEGGFRGFHRNAAHGGVEVALDLQLFPKKPLIIETEVAAAYVSNGPLYTVESSAGVVFGRFEVLGGLRILKNKSDDLLDGFRVGLRVWY